MAFKFNWPDFTTEFVDQAKQLLTTALNKSNKPANIVDHIVVKDLNMGTKAPELEIMEIGELAVDKFRGIFKLIYSGDAHLTLQTKVQANPMNSNKSDVSMYTRRGILAADQPLVVPMLLRLSNLKLRGIIVLVISKQKGITLVFKNDPLEKVDVTSTFDSISSIQRFLQTEIEKRLRIMFQEDLPSIVHQLSLQKWLNVSKRKEETTLKRELSEKDHNFDRNPLHHLPENTPYDTMSMPDLRYHTPLSTPSSEFSSISPESSYYAEDSYSNMGDLDSLDGYPGCSTYSNFGDLFDRQKEEGLKAISQPDKDHHSDINRPRVFHRQRFLVSPKPQRRDSLPTWLPSIQQEQSYDVRKPLRRHVLNEVNHQLSPIITASQFVETVSLASNKMTAANLQRHNQYQVSERTQPSHHSFLSPNTSNNLPCDGSLNSSVHDFNHMKTQTCTNEHDILLRRQEIVLQPSETSVAAQLATLMNSNHTISPYTRTLQHLTFRSFPHPANKTLTNKRKLPGKVVVKRNILKFPGLTTGFGQCNNNVHDPDNKDFNEI
ncbi:6475_t:CDS:2 [Funneliformis caledonium]|uniref:Mitochondrial distribution and morphology protein 34 n=1 Tax=Funneliformis caledonium TaxID=1117310 RepID=A0A9N9A6B8_9GLOM|nr:6475_t:CDS:2 [Funneliformis caledonium]